MKVYFKLIMGIILIALAVGGVNFFIPNKPGATSIPKSEIYSIVLIAAAAFLTGFYLIYKALKNIPKKEDVNSH
jgi:hypothetical protein